MVVKVPPKSLIVTR